MSKRGSFKVFGSKLQLVGKEEKEVGTRRRPTRAIETT